MPDLWVVRWWAYEMIEFDRPKSWSWRVNTSMFPHLTETLALAESVSKVAGGGRGVCVVKIPGDAAC